MCVPDYVQAQPDNTGWTYSQALIGVVEQYKVQLIHADDNFATFDPPSAASQTPVLVEAVR